MHGERSWKVANVLRGRWCHRLSAEAISPAKGRKMQNAAVNFSISPNPHIIKSRMKRYQTLSLFFSISEGESLWRRLMTCIIVFILHAVKRVLV